jgi:hypothetical protein
MDQNKQSISIFTSVLALRKVIGDSDVLQIIHPGAVWNASFVWNPPIALSVVKSLELLLEKDLPQDYVIFLTQISDGALLYYDSKYGQWGYRIYCTQEINERQARWKDVFADSWMQSFLAIGKIVDEDHPIIVDNEVRSQDGLGNQLIEGNPLDPLEYWLRMSSSFHEWLDHLITAQGAKFWDWK